MILPLTLFPPLLLGTAVIKANIMERSEEKYQIMASDAVVRKLFATTDVTTGASTKKVV